jgi:hypothetical protein
MTLTTTGKPDYTPNAYYLVPASGDDKVVAHTAVTDTALAVASYAETIEPALQGTSATLNICPSKASSTTAAGLGAIGYLISGTAMFNPYEADGSTPAVGDNASYTFTDSSGTKQTAYFLDECDSHSNGSTWHAHGNPNCVTSSVDTSTGPSHIIGVAVLPIGVTTKYASINCYSGTVSEQTMAQAKKLACNMKTMFAMLRQRREVQPKMEGMEAMNMPGGSKMQSGSM